MPLPMYSRYGYPTSSTATRGTSPEERALAARREYEAIGAQAPGGFDVPVEDSLRRALQYKLEGGMSSPEYDAARRRIMGGMGTALSRGARASGSTGFYSPHSVAQANAPVFQQAGTQLADLEARRAALRSQSVGEALSAGTSLAPITAREREAEQRGYGEAYRRTLQAGGYRFQPGNMYRSW